MTNTTQINVVIAAYNAASRITNTLDSLVLMQESLQQDCPSWQLFFIDNNSQDQTHEIVLSYADKLPLQLSKCTKRGKSAALNSILDQLNGEIIIFTDDDVQVARDWIKVIYDCAVSKPEYDIFTGNIIPNWETEIDQNLQKWAPLGSTYAIREHNHSFPCNANLVWGPNMAVRHSALLASGIKFNEDIGPSPSGLYPMGQETNFTCRLEKLGYKSYHDHKSVVHHLIKKNTINEDWIIKRAERLAYGLFVNGKDAYQQKLTALPLYLELIFFRVFWTVMFFVTYLLPKSKKRFWCRWRYYFYRGLLKGYDRFLKP